MGPCLGKSRGDEIAQHYSQGQARFMGPRLGLELLLAFPEWRERSSSSVPGAVRHAQVGVRMVAQFSSHAQRHKVDKGALTAPWIAEQGEMRLGVEHGQG